MPSFRSHRNIMIGVIALQQEFITRSQLIDVMNAWAEDKSQPVDELLISRGLITPAQRSTVLHLVGDLDAEGRTDPFDNVTLLKALTSLQDLISRVENSDVRSDVENTLKHLADTAADGHEGTSHDHSEGKSVGGPHRFQIIRPHARGGLGEVFVAKDTELGREVALKEIQLKHAFHEISRSRFVAEAEITGNLEHPGIVPVYGLGRYADGRPFYAMRFIRGESLQESIDAFHRRNWHEAGTGARTLELRKLLGRFVDVCQAIEYAHFRGVLHRDLKPGNVMLGKYGETLVVDWGLARAIDHSESGRTGEEGAPIKISSGSHLGMTHAGSAVGTPSYMSPEQAEGRLDLLGPASDIYGLGATLYSLLTGQLPVNNDNLAECLRKVQCGEVTPPRSIDPTIPKPLEAICLKAMSLRPADRYRSSALLADDIEHWLSDEPIKALRDPPLVRIQRWSRKHPGPVSAIAATVLVGLVGLASGLYFVNAERRRTADERDAKEIALRSEKEQRERAEENEKSEQIARRNSQAKEAETAAVLNFVENTILAAGRPQGKEGGLGRDITLNSAIQSSLGQIEKQFKNQPEIESRVRNTIGISFEHLGKSELARRQFQIAVDLCNKHAGPDHPETLRSMGNLAKSLSSLGRTSEALKLNQTVHKLQTSKLGPDHPHVLSSLNNLGASHYDLGRFGEAAKLFEEAWTRRKALLGADHPQTLESLSNHAAALVAMGRLTEALKLNEEAFALRRSKYGEDNADTLVSMNNLALNYARLGMHDKALRIRGDALKRIRSKFGPDHPYALASMNNLADSYSTLGQDAEACRLFEETVALHVELRGPLHPATLKCKENLAEYYTKVNRHDDALRCRMSILESCKEKLGPSHVETLRCMAGMGINYSYLRQPGEATKIIAEAFSLIDALRRKGEVVPAVILKLLYLGRAHALESLAKYPEAEKEWAAAIRLSDLQDGNKLTAERNKYREMRKKFPDAPKSDPKAAGGTSDGKQASQKKAGETKSSNPTELKDRRSYQ